MGAIVGENNLGGPKHLLSSNVRKVLCETEGISERLISSQKQATATEEFHKAHIAQLVNRGDVAALETPALLAKGSAGVL